MDGFQSSAIGGSSDNVMDVRRDGMESARSCFSPGGRSLLSVVCSGQWFVPSAAALRVAGGMPLPESRTHMQLSAVDIATDESGGSGA